MIEQIIKRWLYVNGMRWMRDSFDVRIHYKQQYRQEYLQGPRWYILRTIRLWWDGWQCVDCGVRYPLEVHHTSYKHKGEGWGITELLDLRTVCRDCHRDRHGLNG